MSSPALEQYFLGYVHEDWTEESPDILDTASLFARWSPEVASLLPGEVSRVLQSQNEREVAEFLDQWSPSYFPPAEGWTYRGWLQAVSDRVTRTLAENGGRAEKGDMHD